MHQDDMTCLRTCIILRRHPDFGRKGSVMAEDAAVFFGFARNMLAHAALQAPADSDRFLLTSGLAKIATGLEILSAELTATHKELDDIKTLLLQMQRRSP